MELWEFRSSHLFKWTIYLQETEYRLHTRPWACAVVNAHECNCWGACSSLGNMQYHEKDPLALSCCSIKQWFCLCSWSRMDWQFEKQKSIWKHRNLLIMIPCMQVLWSHMPEIDTLQLRAWSLGISELSINVSLHVGYAVIQRFQFPSAMTEPNLSLEGALCTWSAKQHFITRLITPQAILSYLFDLEKRWCFRPCMCY